MFSLRATKRSFNSFCPFGIIAGSGPEAGIDLWGKSLAAARQKLGSKFGGDADAPFFRIISDPALGLAGDSDRNRRLTRLALLRSIREIAKSTAVYTIACNALQLQATKLVHGNRAKRLLTFDEAVDARLEKLGIRKFVLLGISSVASLGPNSIYSRIRDKYEISAPEDQSGVDVLISDIKRLGANEKTVVQRMQSLLDSHCDKVVVLACTDFPLVPAVPRDGSVVIDATEALAEMAIERVYCWSPAS